MIRLLLPALKGLNIHRADHPPVVNALLSACLDKHWNNSRFIFAVMLRKMLVLAMLTVYSASAVGVPLHYHYCKGELQHITLFTQKECDSHEKHEEEAEKSPFACCLSASADHCGMVDDPDCCDDESDLIQLDDEMAAAIMPFNVDNEFCAATFNPLEETSVCHHTEAGFDAHAPPVPAISLYLAHCSFVFYG